MKGKLQKLSKGWTIWYNEDPVGGNISFVDSLPLYPLGVANMIDDSYNGEEVEFEIQDFWETGLEDEDFENKDTPTMSHKIKK